MNGAIPGDIIGSLYEFARDNKSKDFPLFCKRSTFTDDTVMTVAAAKAFVDAEADSSDEWIMEHLADTMRAFGMLFLLEETRIL